MLPETAHFALILALCASLLQCILMISADSAALYQSVKRACYLQAILCSFALFALSYAFISNDFSVMYVAQHSSRELPWWYRLTAIWGAHEGSMLLWATFFAVWSALAATSGQHLPRRDHQMILTILGFISVGFLSFILFTSNPFARLLPNSPINGRDLNPLLQDPGFLLHPPMLYMGYVGCGIIYAALLVNLIKGDISSTWLQWIKPWSIAAWSFLTLGITLGSWWSYRVLGWGGYWAWDPVENASLLPWCVLTAFIHSLIVSIRRKTFYAWTVLLGILSFALSLLGTFLVRSGVLTSVHAFAVDPTRGIFILGFLFVVIALALMLYASRVHLLVKKVEYHFWSKETAIIINNYILMSIMFTILLGTLYPMIIDALGLGKLSVGAPYFNRVVLPLAIPLGLLIGIGPLSFWRQDNPHRLWQLLKIPVMLTSTILLICLFVNLELVLGLSMAAWIIITTAINYVHAPTGKSAMTCAHIGLGLFILGLTITTNYSAQRYVKMGLHDSVIIAPYRIQLESIGQANGQNYQAQTAHFAIYRHGKKIGESSSDKRLYTVQNYPMSHPGIFANLWRDIYIALGDEYSDHAWSVRIYYKPGIRFIWLGGLLMVVGGVLSLSRREEQYA